MIKAVKVDEWYRGALERALSSCKACRGTGNVIVPSDDPLDYQVQPCECKATVQKQAKLIWANIPTEFWRSESEGLEWNTGHYAIVKSYANRLDQARRTGDGLLMVGENGVGKTFSACHIITRALSQGYTAGYLTSHEFTVYRRSWDDKALLAWLDEMTGADFLVLDEVGKEHRAKGSDWVAAEFDTLLRRRRGYLLPTIIISNLTVLQFKERYGESLWSIMKDRMKVLQYAPGDFRGELKRRGGK